MSTDEKLSLQNFWKMKLEEQKKLTASHFYDPHDRAKEYANMVNYEPLKEVLDEALDQAANGKGRERHANGRVFERQPIMEVGRMAGPGFAIGQAMKKSQEAMTMYNGKKFEPAEHELLGAIVYLAAAIMLIREP